MNDQNKDGGPAFPKTVDGNHPTQDGMSLRDWFAGMALQGLCSVDDGRLCPREREADVEAWRAETRRDDANYCYCMADAMIAERNKAAP